MTSVPTPANDTADWWVQVRGQAYGPYSPDQLAQFVHEGRVRPSTPVSTDPNSGWQEARRYDALMAAFRGAHGEQQAQKQADVANIFVFAEIHSGAWGAFMAALASMGKMCEIAPGLWLVRTRFTAGVVRNTLSQTLERGDRFLVSDATRDRVAWFGFGPEMDVKIKEVWNAPLPETRKR